MKTCHCKCHRGDATGPQLSPLLDEPVATATACSRCRDDHWPPPAWEPPSSSVPRVFDPSDDTD